MVRNGLVRAEWQQFANPQWRRKRFRRRLPQRFARRLPESRCKLRSGPGTAALDNCTRCRTLDAIRLLSAK